MQKTWNIIGWRTFWFFCILNTVLVFRFLPGFVEELLIAGGGLTSALVAGVERGFEHVAYHLEDRFGSLYVHMLIGGVAMIFMPFQFITRLRMKRPAVHRWMGRVAVAAMVISGATAIPLGMNMNIPLWGQLGYAASAIAWIIVPLVAIYFAITRDLQRHKVWMIYAAAVTFGAVALRFYVPGFRHIGGFSLEIASSLAPWASLIGNIAIVWIWRNWPAGLAFGAKPKNS